MNKAKQEETKRKAVAAIQEVVRQTTNEGAITHIPASGDPDFDAFFRVQIEMINEIKRAIAQMDAEITALGEREIITVLGSRGEIDQELEKRAAAQTIIAKHQLRCSGIMESARQKFLTLNLSKARERQVLRTIESGGPLSAKLDPAFSLRLRMKRQIEELTR